MGFSLVAAAAIIGVSILVCTEIIIGNVSPTITGINDSYDDMKNRAIEQVQTDINITSATTASNGSNYDLNVAVKNTGSVSLKTSDFSILVDGTKQQFTCSDSYLYPEKTVYFNVNNIAGNGLERLKIITDKGISDYYSYILP